MKILLLIILLVSGYSAFSQGGIFQKKNKELDQIEAPKSLLEMSARSDKNQMDHLITCLDKYHSERLSAFGILLISAGSGIGSSAVTDSGTRDGLLVLSGVSGLASLIVYINAERWISRKKLTFKGNGLAYRF